MTYSTRLVTVLGMIMFLSFYLADKWAFSSNHDQLLYARIGVSLILGLTFISTYKADFSEKFYAFILPVPYVVASTAVNYMIYLASPGDYASQVYFAGLMLIIMMMFGWSFLSLTITMAISVYILSLYSYIELSSSANYAESHIVELIINLAFLVSAAIIGFISQLIRDRHLRENFLLQQSLKNAYTKKSEEARDNEYLANHDSLTDLPNRRYMMELLNRSLDVASQKGKVLVIMFIDLNGFKQINDIYGHNAGDEVLLIVAKRLELAIRQGDQLSRLGGDEYLMGLMMEKENLGEIEAMASKFVDVIAQPMNVEGLRVKVGASIGVAAYPIHGNNIEALINIADHRMYQVKKGKTQRSYEEESNPDNMQQSVVIFPGNKNKNKN
ncbi:MAG: diguanylate cyclase [Cocleimonas sp.]